MELHLDRISVVLGERRVLHDVSLRFEPGMVTGLLGPNGAGKSTLLRAIVGLVPVSSGTVRLGNAEVSRLGRKEIARRAAYLPQAADVPFPFRTEDVVMMGRYPHLKRFESESEADVREVNSAMRAVDAEALRGRAVTELSGGERQRVLLARTLATGAPTLLMDEPIANLDIRHALELLEAFKRQAEAGKTVVVAIHDVNLAYQFCSRFVLLKEGRVLASGGAEVLRSAALAEAFDVEARLQSVNGHGWFLFSRRGA